MDSKWHSSAQIFLAIAFVVSIGAAILLESSTTTAQSQTVAHVVIENGVRIKMRDGVSLVADIYRPRGEGKYPVLLERTPYDRKDESSMAYELSSHGYVVVLQDTRGRYESGGECLAVPRHIRDW